ncbi:hypothetical protein FE257_011783 [Aspergillus nanangensis]|uniref:Uncharacterized protein n=1 Tax=Aspergillus nanangensis TaxID=2582783 RepID=A0AAD4GXY4_ASPNN|nr:hypothetical protein FE257_011783 [Aspergillus nanangensis]
MEEIRAILETSGRDLELNKRMLEDVRRQFDRRVDRRAADQRDRKRRSPECLQVRQGVIDEYVQNILHSSSRTPVKYGYGDVAVDVHLYANHIRTDTDVFKELYGVDVDLAAAIVENNCDDIQTLLDDMAEKRMEGAEISTGLFTIFEELVECLKAMETIPRRLEQGTRLSEACMAIKSGLGTPAVDVFRMLKELRREAGRIDRTNSTDHRPQE